MVATRATLPPPAADAAAVNFISPHGVSLLSPTWRKGGWGYGADFLRERLSISLRE
jgi:hypothetical protein